MPKDIPDESMKAKPKAAEVRSPVSASEKVADKPHRITIRIGILSPAIAVIATIIALLSFWNSQRSMKVGQRAYLTYQVVVSNGREVVEALHADKDFFLNYQVQVTNMGNTPADSIYPKITVGVDPDRTPVMVNFPTLTFDLGPKESRVLNGQALFKHFHNVRGIPGLSTGFAGQIEYKDVFGDSQVKQVCYTFLISGDSPSGGMCGTVMQPLQIK